MTAFAGSEPEKAGKTAKSSEGAAADKSETDEIEKSRQMQFEARAAAEAEKEQLFLKKSEKVPNELLVLVGGFAFFGWLYRAGYLAEMAAFFSESGQVVGHCRWVESEMFSYAMISQHCELPSKTSI